MKDHSISVDQYIYATYIVEKSLETATVKAIAKFYKTTLPADMIFTKYDTSTSDEQVENLTREVTFTTDLALVDRYIYCLQEWT